MNDIERRVSDLERRMERLEEFLLVIRFPDPRWFGQFCERDKGILEEIQAEWAAREGREGEAEPPALIHLCVPGPGPWMFRCGLRALDHLAARVTADPALATCLPCLREEAADISRIRAIESAARAWGVHCKEKHRLEASPVLDEWSLAITKDELKSASLALLRAIDTPVPPTAGGPADE